MTRPPRQCRYCNLPLDMTGRTNGKTPNFCRYNKCHQKMGFFEARLAELPKFADKRSMDFHTYLLFQMIMRKPMDIMYEPLKLYVREMKKNLRAVAKT